MEKTDEATVPSAQTGTTTLHEALSHQLQIMRLNRKMVLGYSASGNCAALLDLLQPKTDGVRSLHPRPRFDRSAYRISRSHRGRRRLGNSAAQACTASLLDLVQPSGPRRTNPHHCRSGPIYVAQPRPRRLLHAIRRPFRYIRLHTDLYPTRTRNSGCPRIPRRRS